MVNFFDSENLVKCFAFRAAPSRGSANDTIPSTPVNRRKLQELYVEEKKSLQALKSFVGRACEVLHLWKVLYDHQFHLVAATLSSVGIRIG